MHLFEPSTYTARDAAKPLATVTCTVMDASDYAAPDGSRPAKRGAGAVVDDGSTWGCHPREYGAKAVTQQDVNDHLALGYRMLPQTSPDMVDMVGPADKRLYGIWFEGWQEPPPGCALWRLPKNGYRKVRLPRVETEEEWADRLTAEMSR